MRNLPKIWGGESIKIVTVFTDDNDEEGRRGSKRSRTASRRYSTSGWPPVKLSQMKACKECDGCKARKACTNKIPR